MKNIFEILDIRKKIFSYIYPVKVVKDMKIKILKYSIHPFLAGKVGNIYKITKKKHNYVIMLMNHKNHPDFYWFKILAPIKKANNIDKFQVIHYIEL